jgi:phospho-N-acetylmuramoyl-pentapeptide-transferase
MGGVIIWGTVILIAALFALIHAVFPDSFAGSLHFLSRGQTLLPIFSLVAAGIVGLADDLLNIWGIGKNGGGVEVQHRMVLYTIIAGVGAWWFAAKLDWDLVHIPFFGDLAIGLWYIPLFLLVIIATAFSVNQTDGLDGLAGGTLISAYAAYAIICLLQGRYDLAVFCGVVSGALLAFLWFNIYPARFFMGDTGAMSLGVTLGIVAMLTNTALILPIIGGIFVIEAITTILQLVSKKLFKKKIFLVAPIHHHFEAIGWPEPKVVMRFWVLSWIFAAIGLSVIILDMSL